MRIIKPNILIKGDKIVIPSPAGRVTKESVNQAAKILESNGFIVELSKNCASRYFNYSAEDSIRLKELQEALDDDLAKAIICSRGGYGAGRILDKLDFTKFIANPKWIVGFSDITNLHLVANELGLMTIHGPMTQAFTFKEDLESVQNLIDLLKGVRNEYVIEPHELNRFGKETGILVGGNLSIIYSLQSTNYEINTDGKILFIEDLNEYLYHLDRIMINLKLSGKLVKLKGIVVGGFTDMKDHDNPFGKTAYEIILEHVQDYDFPVCFNFPAGHISNNQPFILGETYSFEVKNKEVSLIPLS
jgi:muramoyltetrapeptide carboxypeptidase